MGVTRESNLVKLMKVLGNKINKGKEVRYSVPDLWSCFGYEGEEKIVGDNGAIYVNPYKFYHDCIKNYIMPNYDSSLNYKQSISSLTHGFKVKIGYLGGDWIKKSTIYSMHIRTSTSWDHDESGFLEDENKTGLKETGTFVKTIALIPLLKKMGINTLYLLPISKYSTKFKKGELGSPYAVKNFFEMDPNLKDPMTGNELTVEEEFGALVEACHIMGIRVMIDIIPRTCARDNDLIMDHPDWFYWIRSKDLVWYNPPYVHGVDEAEKPSYDNMHQVYSSEQVWNHIKKFTVSPDQFDSVKWAEIKAKYKKNPKIDFLQLIEDEIGLTTAPAFSDCINDPQPPWTDVTYFRLYMDNPVQSRHLMTDPWQAPYILFDTIKGNLFKGEQRNEGLWNAVSDIIPYYQDKFGIDGARVDMGHALPSELVQMILDKPRAKDVDFAFIAEELLLAGAEIARNTGYNMIIGYGWWLEPRAYDHKTHEFMYGARDFKAPVFACAETPDTPRIAAREGGRYMSKLTTLMNLFVPNAVPFINSGLELYETQPMNTGLDCRPDERYRLHHDDPYNGKLAFFDKYQFHWTNDLRWDLPDTLQTVTNFRNMFIDTISNPDNFIPLGFGDPRLPAIGLGWMVEGRRWQDHDNLIIAVCNTDLMNEREFTIDLGEARYQSGNASRKAWLVYSANEWSHDIYDFDDKWNLKLRFKPAEVKILIM
ncbi:MAG: alpha-amylase family glycosyl hydrolase [Bacillota bacterium]|nr:alpha-amylase family glycosyl hydrolase [Bacillota bacterium]